MNKDIVISNGNYRIFIDSNHDVTIETGPSLNKTKEPNDTGGTTSMASPADKFLSGDNLKELKSLLEILRDTTDDHAVWERTKEILLKIRNLPTDLDMSDWF